MPLDHLRAVAQDDQGGNCAEAASPEVNGWSVVNLAVDNRIDQFHDLGGEFEHSRRRLRVVLRPVVTHPELRGGLFEVYREFLVVSFLIFTVLVIQFVLRLGLIRTQIRVVLVMVFGGHGRTLTLTLS